MPEQDVLCRQAAPAVVHPGRPLRPRAADQTSAQCTEVEATGVAQGADREMDLDRLPDAKDH